MALDPHHLIRPVWPPVRHIERGWEALDDRERQEVAARVEAVLSADPLSPRASRPSLTRFFTFLAQVETIAIEIPLRFLPEAPDDLVPLLRAQLVDEVFHSCLFSRLAHDLAAPAALPDAPIESAEALLQTIRSEEDLGVSATLLNLVAEGWIEGLFDHAVTWGVADPVFATVLADEERHVEEAHAYQGDLDRDRAREALHRLEDGLIRLGQEPSVALAMRDLAGEDAYRRMLRDLLANHRVHLAEVDLEPGPAWQEQERLAERFLEEPIASPARATVVADTPWRTAARSLWSTPRDPSMQGAFDLPVGHIPKRQLTAVIVAAVGRAWAEHPALNRVLAKGRIWQLPRVNVGVRVAVAEGELSTVVITDADQRSLRDIERMIRTGAEHLRAIHDESPEGDGYTPDARTFDPATLSFVEPGADSFSVAVSNPGRFGLVTGAGALSGELAPATDVTIGERRRLPRWYGVTYLPAWHTTLGCVQDHRVFDGREAGLAMRAVGERLTRRGYKDLARAPDTLDDAGPVVTLPGLPQELMSLQAVGFVKYLPVIVAGGAAAAAGGAAAYYVVKKRQEDQEREEAAAGATPPPEPADERPPR